MSSGNVHERLAAKLERMDRVGLQGYIQRLAREKVFFETVFNTIHEGVVVIDRNLRVSYANYASRRLLGLGEDVVGIRINRFLRDVDWDHFLEAGSAGWPSAVRRELEIFYPEHRHLSFYIVPLNDLAGDAIEGDRASPLVAVILHDITESVQTAEQTLETEKIQALTLLAAGVAHELGNPLNGLNIHLQLLARLLKRADDQELAAEAGELLQVARQEVERLDGIVSNFLRAVRPVPLQLSPLQPATLLLEVLEFMKTEIADRGISVEFHPPERLPSVKADAGQLKQAFFNLVKNAIQAMPNGGRLEVACAADSAWFAIRFADTGPGIPAHVLPHILEPYFTTKENGSGLGLLIVERIVRAHGGELAIESSEGRGATFIVRLPLGERQPRLLENPTAKVP